MKNILLVGGAGYIGGTLTNQLVDAGYNVVVYDNLLYEERFLKKVAFHYGDIRDTQELLKIEKKYDTVIWLAAIVGDGACSQDPELTMEINFNSLKRFLDASKRRILFPSTCSVYGMQDGLLTENSPVRPLSAYAETKHMAEEVVIKYGGLVFRLGTLFGIGDEFSRIRLDLVINYLTFKALHDKKITVFGGAQWRPVLNVRDAAAYFAEAVTRNYNDIFNIGMKNIRIVDLAALFKNMFPDIRVEVVDTKFEDSRNYQVSTEKVNSNFIFRPLSGIEQEIDKMRELLASRRIKNPLDARYYNTHFVKGALEEMRKI